MDDRRDDGAHQNAQKPVGRQPLQDALHPVAGSGLQAGAHHLYAVQEQRKTAQQSQHDGIIHVPSLIL